MDIMQWIYGVGNFVLDYLAWWWGFMKGMKVELMTIVLVFAVVAHVAAVLITILLGEAILKIIRAFLCIPLFVAFYRVLPFAFGDVDRHHLRNVVDLTLVDVGDPANKLFKEEEDWKKFVADPNVMETARSEWKNKWTKIQLWFAKGLFRLHYSLVIWVNVIKKEKIQLRGVDITDFRNDKLAPWYEKKK